MNVSRGTSRRRGRPPGRRQLPQLAEPESPHQFGEDDMPDLEPAVRKSKRVIKNKKQ